MTIVFVNRTTPIDTLIKLNIKIKETNIFTLDTESVSRKFQSNLPALIQLQLCSEPSSIIIIEVQHLPKQNEKEFQLIKNLFNSLFIKEKKIFIWGEIEELKEFIQFNLFNLQQIKLSTNRNVQKEFKAYWNEVYPHNEDPNQQCQCKYCFGIDHDNLLSLQDAVAFQLRQWLDKRLTRQAFNIGLDPQLKRLNQRELEYRKSLLTYAANDCDAIYQIILHSNIINYHYPKAAQVNEVNNEFDTNGTAYEFGNNTTAYEFDFDEMNYELDEEITINQQGQVIITGTAYAIINTNNQPTTTPAINHYKPEEVEQVSSDEEPMDVTPKQQQPNKLTTRVKPEPTNDKPYEPPSDNKPAQIQIDQVNIRPLSPTTNAKPTAPPRKHPKYTSTLSEAERKKIHNRSRTRHQRRKAYEQEIILYNIEKRFPVKVMKQTLKEHGVLITQINPVESMRTGETILFVVLKQPVKKEQYEKLQELFTYQNYRRLFQHKFKHKQQHQHRHTRPTPRTYENDRRHYH